MPWPAPKPRLGVIGGALRGGDYPRHGNHSALQSS